MATVLRSAPAVQSSATPPRAAIYVRVSTLEQSEHGYSLDAQVQDCRKLAAEIKAEVISE